VNRYVIHIKLDYHSTFSGAQLDYHSAFWFSQSDHYPENNLAKFDYIPSLKVERNCGKIVNSWWNCAKQLFLYWWNLSKKEENNFRNEVSWRGSIARSEEKKKWKSSDFYIWFSVCSHKHRRLIKYLYFIFGL
jgi:hypothetical protein